MNTFKMAYRNIWRNKRRSVVTISAMSLALFAMILYSGLLRGYIIGMKKNVLNLEVGDMQAFAPGYLQKPSIYKQLDNYKQLEKTLKKAGYKTSGRLIAAGLGAAKNNSAGILIRGVDPKSNHTVSTIDQEVMSGQWLNEAHPKGAVIGKKLARLLSVKPGDELIVLSQGADGSMANDLYTVRGVLNAINEKVDAGGVYLVEQAFRDLMVLPVGVHQLIIRKPEHLPLAAAADNAKSLLPGVDVRSWRELMPTLASMMEMSSSTLYVMFVIVYVAIGIVILNVMLMAVFERIREFGILKAVGFGPGTILKTILFETGIMTGLSVVIGSMVSIPGLYYLSKVGLDLSALGNISMMGVAFDPYWKAHVSVDTIVGPAITLTIIAVLASVYPALKAAFIRPVAAIYHR